MRFNGRNFLLGLATLGSLPESFGRALPTTGVELYNQNYVRAAPIRITPGKGPHEGTPGGKPGDTPGTNDKPDGDSPPPARIGTGDKTPDDAPKDKPVHIGAGDNKDVDLWCRGSGCGGKEEPKLLTAEELSARGDKGVELASNPSREKDYTQQEADNYSFKKSTKEEFEEDGGVEDSIPTLGFDKKYGFDAEDGWQKISVHSKDNNLDPVVAMSFGRGTKGGNDYVSIVAHARFAKADGNRYQLTDKKDNAVDKDGNLVPNPDAATKAVPAAQLVHDATKQSGILNGKPAEKILLVSENVVNPEAKRSITEAHRIMEKVGQPNVLRKGAPGVEGEQFRILAGTDNNYSYLNTVGRNPETFKGYEIVSIETRESPPTMSIELGKITKK